MEFIHNQAGALQNLSFRYIGCFVFNKVSFHWMTQLKKFNKQKEFNHGGHKCLYTFCVECINKL